MSEPQQLPNLNKNSLTRKQIVSLVLLAASLVYDILPADLIPDVPLVGWVDDILVTSTALMNCIQQFSESGSQTLQEVLKWLKWTCILLAILIVLVLVLLTSIIISLFK